LNVLCSSHEGILIQLPYIIRIMHPVKCMLLSRETKNKFQMNEIKDFTNFVIIIKWNINYRVCTANFVGRYHRDGVPPYLSRCVSLQHIRLMTYTVTRKQIIHALIKLTKYKIILCNLQLTSWSTGQLGIRVLRVFRYPTTPYSLFVSISSLCNCQ